MFTVYVLKSKVSDKTYVGFTNDLERRLYEHNLGKSKYTRRYIPWEIVYKEFCSNRTDARKREKYLKSAAGRRYLKKIL